MLSPTTDEKRPIARERRHNFRGWPHVQAAATPCRLCCEELAAEFSVEEAQLLERVATLDSDETFGTSEALPF